jgi:hypothetical protein
MTTQELEKLAHDRLEGSYVGTRYHYYAEEVSQTFSVTLSELRLLGRMLRDGESDAYSLWCAATPSRVVR